LGYSDTSASLSVLSDAGTKINLGGLNVDKVGLFFTEEVELPPFTQVESQRLIISDTGSGFFYPEEIVHFGSIDYGQGDKSVIGYTSSRVVQLEIGALDYQPSLPNWDLTYFSGGFLTPFGGPATKTNGIPYELHGWRDDPVEAPENASLESWFIDWRIDKNATITGYSFTYDTAEGYSYLQLPSGFLDDELDITDQEINVLRGDTGIFPAAGGGDGSHDVGQAYGNVPSGSMPVLWIDSAEDADQNYTWANEARVAYQIIDVVNSTTSADDFDYDTLVLGARVYPSVNGSSFETDFASFESTYGVSSANSGVAPSGATPSIQESVFRNIQMTWMYPQSDASTNYTGTELSLGFLQGVPIDLETVRLHSSGSNGNTRPFYQWDKQHNHLMPMVFI